MFADLSEREKAAVVASVQYQEELEQKARDEQRREQKRR